MPLELPPTKSALLYLRRQLRFIEQGHDMLERKRELLSLVVRDRLKDYLGRRAQARQALAGAYRWLGIAELRMGGHVLEQLAVGLEPALAVSILPRSSVGVEYPTVAVELLPGRPVALMWTDPSFDAARAGLLELVALLARLGEAETALRRLLAEERKTQKRVNALRYNVIPRHRRRLAQIEATLAEEERMGRFLLQRFQGEAIARA
jgi:V/A-type H+-transporting ATPase subunit D